MVKKLFGFRTKYKVRLLLQQFKSLDYFKKTNLDESKKHAFIFLAADYGNLGDVAITYAQTKFLTENLNDDFEVIEIPISKSLEGFYFVKKNLKPEDIITTVGGGNLGDMYDQIEYIRQLVVKFYPNNKIISFPQTFDFTENKEGKKALEIAKKTYNKHNNLVFVAREETSFLLMKKHFNKTSVLKTPDIVLSLNKEQPIKERNGVVMTMRKDKEKNLSEQQTQFINNVIKERFQSIQEYDTHIKRNHLSIDERESELNKIWETFKSAELVITDRLHGMIFCYITNTPCLVFQNNNHKVRETYDWIKGNSNINMIDEFSEDKIQDFLNTPNFNTGELIEIQSKYQSLLSYLN
ncbi:MAG: polysaccharide pyruvyl transferase family protein [Psychroflexus halocasei]